MDTHKFKGQSLLVIGHAYIGDALMTLPFIAALIKANPQKLTVLAPSPGLAIYARLPGVTNAEERGPTASPIKRLRLAGYDTALVLKDDFASALLAWRARIPKRIGFAGEGARLLLTEAVTKKNAALHGAMRYFALLGKDLPEAFAEFHTLFPTSPAERKRAAAILASLPEPVIAFAPTTTRAEKDWPLKRCHAFLRQTLGAGISVVLLGGEKDILRHQDICTWQTADGEPASKRGTLLDLSGQTTLGETAALLADIPLLVCCDSGPMHLAAAMGTHIIALFGQSDPERSGPLPWHPDGVQPVIVRSALSCAPCLRKRCGENAACMQSIEERIVFEYVYTFLKRGRRYA